jgi:peptide/nickel transport system permease protein
MQALRAAENLEIGAESVPRASKASVWSKFIRNPMGMVGAIVLVLVIIGVIFAPWLTAFNPIEQNLGKAFLAPGIDGHLLGTDSLGRDVLSRMLYGGRLSLLIALVGTLVGMGIGIPIGVVSGYYGGKIDSVVMRIIDVMLAFPYLLLSIVIVGGLGPGLVNVTFSIATSTIPFYVRLLRGLAVGVRNQQFIEAARTIGASDLRIMWNCVLRSILPYIIVNATLNIGYVLLAVAGLNFLGFGVQPPTAEWGGMLAENRSFITLSPVAVLAPGTIIAVTVLALNLTGDALRDALDVSLSDAR